MKKSVVLLCFLAFLEGKKCCFEEELLFKFLFSSVFGFGFCVFVIIKEVFNTKIM